MQINTCRQTHTSVELLFSKESSSFSINSHNTHSIELCVCYEGKNKNKNKKIKNNNNECYWDGTLAHVAK